MLRANIQQLVSPPYVSCSFHLLHSLHSWEDRVCTIFASASCGTHCLFLLSPTGWTKEQDYIERRLLWWAFCRITTVLLILCVLQDEQDLHPHAQTLHFWWGKNKNNNKKKTSATSLPDKLSKIQLGSTYIMGNCWKGCGYSEWVTVLNECGGKRG